jgi:hypothetical protein
MSGITRSSTNANLCPGLAADGDDAAVVVAVVLVLDLMDFDFDFIVLMVFLLVQF